MSFAKKIGCLFLALCLLAAALPLSAAADDGQPTFILTQDLENKTPARGEFHYDPDHPESMVAYVASTDGTEIASVTWGGGNPQLYVQANWISIAKVSDTVWSLTITNQVDTAHDFSFSVHVFAQGNTSGEPDRTIDITAHNDAAGGPPDGGGDGAPFIFCRDVEDPVEFTETAVWNYDATDLNDPRSLAYVASTNDQASITKVVYVPGDAQAGWVTVGSIDPSEGASSVSLTISSTATHTADFTFALRIWGDREDPDNDPPSKTITITAHNIQNGPSTGADVLCWKYTGAGDRCETEDLDLELAQIHNLLFYYGDPEVYGARTPILPRAQWQYAVSSNIRGKLEVMPGDDGESWGLVARVNEPFSGRVSFTKDGTTYSIGVSFHAPSLFFSTSPTAAFPENLLGDDGYAVQVGGAPLYLRSGDENLRFAAEGDAFDGNPLDAPVVVVRVDGDPTEHTDWITAETINGGAAIKISMTQAGFDQMVSDLGDPNAYFPSTWVEVRFTTKGTRIDEENAIFPEQGNTGFFAYDARPVLKLIPDSWGNAQKGWWYFSEFYYQPSVLVEDVRFILAPDRTNGFAGPITRLDPRDITVRSLDETVATIEKNTDDAFYTILFKSWHDNDAEDESFLEVTYQGKTYTMPIGLVMPAQDLFAGLERNKSTYLEHRVSPYAPGQSIYLLSEAQDAYISADFNISTDFVIDEGQNYLAELTPAEVAQATSDGTLGKTVGLLKKGTANTWLDVRVVPQIDSEGNQQKIAIDWNNEGAPTEYADRYAVKFTFGPGKAMGDLFISISDLYTTRFDVNSGWERRINEADKDSDGGRIHFMLLKHQHTNACAEWKYASNTTQHWQVCAACGDEKSGSRANHTPDANGVCTACGYKKETASAVASDNTIGTAGSGAGSLTIEGGTLNNQTAAVTVYAGGNSIQYDSAALETIKAAAGANDVTLVVEEAQPEISAQTQAIAAVVADLKEQMEESQWNMDHGLMTTGTLSLPDSFETSGKVVHLSLTQGTDEIENFGGGIATVTADYTVPADMVELVERSEVKYVVYRVEENGGLTEITCDVDLENNTVKWETPSHSYYLITPEAEITPVTPRPVYSGGGADEEGEDEPDRPFTDVTNPKEWYYDAVYYGFDKGYFAGISETEFAPSTTMNRAMFATVLYHMAGKPEITATKSFPDVAAGKWYTNGILWGAAQGIISGYPDGNFGPTDPVTREQMAVLFWNYAGKPTVTADLSKFSDADKISSWAKEAFNWAVSVGIISGKGNGILDPKASATRAEVAQIVMNYDMAGD